METPKEVFVNISYMPHSQRYQYYVLNLSYFNEMIWETFSFEMTWVLKLKISIPTLKGMDSLDHISFLSHFVRYLKQHVHSPTNAADLLSTRDNSKLRRQQKTRVASGQLENSEYLLYIPH